MLRLELQMSYILRHLYIAEQYLLINHIVLYTTRFSLENLFYFLWEQNRREKN